jgi:acyl carrier protein
MCINCFSVFTLTLRLCYYSQIEDNFSDRYYDLRIPYKKCGFLMLDKTSVVSRLLDLTRPIAPGLDDIQGDPLTADLRDAGLTSISAVRLMLDIEAAFDLAIPDGDLTPENFATVRSIERLVERLRVSALA